MSDKFWSNESANAIRVADLISSIKWIIVVVLGVVCGLALLVCLFNLGEGETFVLAAITAVTCGVYALVSFVMFGWFEHTLRALVRICDNTGGAA